MQQSKTIKEACRILLVKVRFERAGFTKPGEYMSDEIYTQEIQESTKRYTESWIVPIIEAIRDGDIKTLKDLIKYD